MYEGKEYLIKDRTFGSNIFSSTLNFFKTTSLPENKVLGVDISHWQGTNDFIRMATRAVRFGITKATDVGSYSRKGFLDSKAVENYIKMGEAGFLRGAYHWLDPHAYSTPQEQAYYYLNEFYFKYPTEIPPVLDFEDREVISYNDMLWRAQIWLEIVEKETGRIPILYTSPGYMWSFDKSKTGFLQKYPLWIAHYINRSYPTVPFPWSDFTIWQYSDRGHFPLYNHPSSGSFGKEWGAGSSYLDMNWFNGTYEELLVLCEIKEPEKPPVPPVVDPIAPLFKAKCIVGLLNVRAEAGISNPIVGSLKQGDIVNVYKEKNGWYAISSNYNQWVSANPSYMQKISITPPPEPSPPEPTNILFKAKCIVTALNVRDRAGLDGKILWQIKNGNIVNVYEIKNGWYRITENKQEWCSGNSNYMIRI